MPSPSWEKLDDFFGLDTNGGFSFPAVIHSQNGWTRTINVIFDDPYFNSQIGEYEADTSNPRITAKESDVVGILRNDTIIVAGETFDVLTSPQQDGTGTAVVTMARQNASL